MQTPKRRIGPVWIVLGILAALIACCCGGSLILGVFGYRRGVEVDREAKLFATPAVIEIGKGWSKEKIKSYAAPSLLPLVDQGKANFYLDLWRKKLGDLKHLGEFSTKGISFGNKNGLPPATRVRMTAPATFQRGEGTIVLGVAKAHNRWEIEDIDIQSESLLKK